MKKILIVFIAFLLACGSSDDADSSSQRQKTILILNKAADTAWQLNAETGQKVAEYKTGDAPHEVAVSPDQSRAIITNYGADTPGNSLTILNLDTREVSKTISLGEYQRPHGVDWFSDGIHAIVTAEAQQAVLIVNINTGEILSAIKTGQTTSHMVKLFKNEETAYVTNLGSGSVSIIDLTSEKVIRSLQTGDGTEGLTAVPSQNEVWITNRSANTVSILDASDKTIVDTLQSSSFPIRAEVSPDEKLVAVSNAQSAEISIFNVNSRKQIRKISTVSGDNEGMPIGLTFSTDGSRLFVANSNLNRIAVINTDNWQVVNNFKTGETPDGIAYINTGN